MRYSQFLLIPAVGLMSSQAVAQQSAGVTLDEITVTAARAQRSISDIPQTVQVVDQKEIDEQLKQSGSASALLAKLLPGFSVSNQTISGASESYRGRDLLVLMDGVPLTTPLRDVSRVLSLIDLNSVERIELVAGASSLYGAGATGGTVNFVTKKAQPGGPRVSVNTALRTFTADPGGSLAPEMSATVSGKGTNGIDYVFVGSGRGAQKTYDGAGRELPSDAMLGQGGGDRLASGNFLGKIGYDFDGGKRIEASISQFYLDQTPKYLTDYSGAYAKPDFTKPYTGQSVLEDSRSFQLRYSDTDFVLGNLSVVGFYNDIKKRFNYSEFSYPYNSLVYYSGNPLSPTSPANQTTLYSERGGVNLTIDTPLDRIWNGAKVTWGTDVVHDKTWQTLTDGRDVFTPLTQVTTAGFALVQVPITDRLTARGGVRYEHFNLSVDDFLRPAAYAAISPVTRFVLPALNVVGGQYEYASPTYNLGATFKLNNKIDLFGGFSQGYALPDVGAYTRRAGLSSTAFACPVATPNCLPLARQTISFSSIAPEAQIVNNYEIGIRGGDGPYKGSITGFVSTSEKGVTFDPVTNLISQQKEMIYGVEYIGEMAINRNFTLGTTIGYKEGRYDTNKDGVLDSWLPNNRIGSPVRGLIFGDYRFDNGIKLRVEGEGYAARNRGINLTNTVYPIEGGFTMNAALSGPVYGGEAYAAVNNLFDTELQNPTATSVRNLPVYSWGRTVTVGYRKTF
ncbi:TonB-dependent receptor [Tardiphaga sp. 841_E9_N1_2]|uniref:TonB-dependent receptor n=1 Tax=Tardiphaga sp. 841_E9_N1_2 TaxID=3240762 RepID=UPI003F1ED741